MAIILKANKVHLFVSSVLFVFWYHSLKGLDTPHICNISWLRVNVHYSRATFASGFSLSKYVSPLPTLPNPFIYDPAERCRHIQPQPSQPTLSVSQTKLLGVLLMSSVCITFPIYLNLLDLITGILLKIKD
jgi:hypothetical protein